MPQRQTPEGKTRLTETERSSAAQRILIIDDEPLFREFVFQALSTSGYDVDTLESAVEALRVLGRSQYDLVLVDIRMPIMTGIEFFQGLEELDPDLQSQVIFMTGDVATPSTQQFLDKANRPVLTKPFDLTVLRQVVAEGLRLGPSTL